MAEVVFRFPSGKREKNPDLELVCQSMLLSPSDFWMKGSGDATIDFVDGDVSRTLLLLPNNEFEIYLKYLEGGKARLSLENPQKLNEVIECLDEWCASKGLFLPKEKAWLAVKEFCETGQLTDKVDWINPSEIPEGGNW
jgi:hypothetical protein